MVHTKAMAKVCVKKSLMKYTGDSIQGIATMHKSNAVPVMKGTNGQKILAQDEAMIEVALLDNKDIVYGTYEEVEEYCEQNSLGN